MTDESKSSMTEAAKEIVDEILQDSIFKSSKSEPLNGDSRSVAAEDDAPGTLSDTKLDKGKQKMESDFHPEDSQQKTGHSKQPTQSPSPLPASSSTITAYGVKTTQTDAGNGLFSSSILIQNENGPCPLLALCKSFINAIIFADWRLINETGNILLLRRQIRIPLGRESIAHTELLGLLGDAILNQTQSKPMSLEYTHILDLIPSLVKGLDVNPRFDSPFSFDKCAAIDLFSLFDIKLCHGWTVDPQDKETYRVVVKEKGSFNQVQEALVAGDIARTAGTDLSQISSDDKREKVLHDDKVVAFICSEFLNATASQLTSHGLISLLESLPPNSLSVLFRNNHFSVLYKRGGGTTEQTEELFTLVTDEGYAKTPDIVWENLRYKSPENTFLGFNFTGGRQTDLPESTSPNEDRDFAFALALQEQEQQRFVQQEQSSSRTPSETPRTRRKKISDNLKKGPECTLM